MKKILLTLTTLVTTTASTSNFLISCSSIKTELKIIFVPSRDASKLQKTIKKLENLLEAKLKAKIKKFDMKVKATTVGTDYNTAGNALELGTVDISFLPASIYTKFRGEKNSDNSYSKAATLLLPTRNSIIADYNLFKDNINKNWSTQISTFSSWQLALEYQKTITNVQNRDDAINKLYKQDCDSPYYRSLIYANKSFLQQFSFDKIKDENDYCKTMKQMINKAIDNEQLYLGSTSSSGGTVYPLSWMKNTLNFSDTEISNIIKKKKMYNSYTDAVENLTNADAQISAGYGDMRIDCADVNKIKQVFENIEVIGATEGVATDAIQYSRLSLGNNYELIKMLRTSFCELISDQSNNDIFDKIYAHKRYCKPDQDDETSSLKWEIEQDEIYTQIDNKLRKILDLQKKFSV